MQFSEGMKSLAKNIIDSSNMRINEVEKIAIDTKKALKSLAEEGKVRASDLQKDLKSFKQGLKKNVDSMMSGLAEEGKVRASDLQKDLKSFKQGLKKNVDSMMSGYKSDHIEAANAWRNMNVTLDKKQGISVQVEQKKKSPEVKPVEKIVEVPEPKKSPEVKPVAKSIAEPAFETSILKIVQQNLHGIEIERIRKFTGVPTEKLNIIVSKLFSDGKISKKGNKYFPGKK